MKRWADYSAEYRKHHAKLCEKIGRRLRARNYALVVEAKSKPCVDCGKKYPVYVMDLDHVRGKKKFALGQTGTRSVAAIQKEIAKCDPVCANCHRERTHRRKNVLEDRRR